MTDGCGVTLVLLPGLDGTGRLFDRFVQETSAARVMCVTLPVDRVLSYDGLVDFLLEALPLPPFILLGESFSGPLALRLARRAQPESVVLCASFIRSMVQHRLVARPLSLLLRAPPPTPAVRTLLAGGDEALAAKLVHAVRTVEPKVIASRVRMVLEVDATADLAAFPGPILYLRATQDRIVSSHQAELFLEVRPDCEVADIDGPHLLLQTRASECWRRILSFAGSRLTMA